MLPSLKLYDETLLQNTVWQRGILSLRDRCLATLTVAVTLNQSLLLAQQVALALKHDVTPSEIDGIITHLGFYSGWGNVMEASHTVTSIFKQLNREIESAIDAKPPLIAIDEASEKKRVEAVEKSVGSQVFPNLVNDTTYALFHDLWLRSDLKPRDRSLVTVCALMANGQFEQISFHLNKAMDNGLTQQEAAELVSHLAYYVGWPKAMSSVPIMKQVFNNRL